MIYSTLLILMCFFLPSSIPGVWSLWPLWLLCCWSRQPSTASWPRGLPPFTPPRVYASLSLRPSPAQTPAREQTSAHTCAHCHVRVHIICWILLQKHVCRVFPHFLSGSSWWRASLKGWSLIPAPPTPPSSRHGSIWWRRLAAASTSPLSIGRSRTKTLALRSRQPIRSAGRAWVLLFCLLDTLEKVDWLLIVTSTTEILDDLSFWFQLCEYLHLQL